MASTLHPFKAARKEQFLELGEILQLLLPLAPATLPQDVKDRVELLPMKLEPGNSHVAAPHYCKLIFSPDDLARASDAQMEVDGEIVWPDYDPPMFGPNFYMGTRYASAIQRHLGQIDYPWCVIAKSSWVGQRPSRLIPFERNMYGYFNYNGVWGPSDQQYGIWGVQLVKDFAQPHVVCILCDDTSTDESFDNLRASETYIAIKLMRASLKRDKDARFKVHPVYIYTFSDNKVRILEVSYESKKIIVRKTPYLKFNQSEEQDKKVITLLMRWMLSEPIGDVENPKPEVE